MRRMLACGSGASIDAIESDLTHLAEAFARVRDKVAALHGPPDFQEDQPSPRGDHDLLGAMWFLGGVNHGFKIKYYEPGRVEIITWAPEGDFASANVRLRSTATVERILRQALPPALLTPPREGKS